MKLKIHWREYILNRYTILIVLYNIITSIKYVNYEMNKSYVNNIKLFAISLIIYELFRNLNNRFDIICMT